jgi:hypothetical protein
MITKETKKQILEMGFYNYIANYYYLHTKEELSELAKEYCYAVYAQDKEIDKQSSIDMWDEIEIEEEEE